MFNADHRATTIWAGAHPVPDGSHRPDASIAMSIATQTSADQENRLDHPAPVTHFIFKSGFSRRRVGGLSYDAVNAFLSEPGPILYQMAFTGSMHGER